MTDHAAPREYESSWDEKAGRTDVWIYCPACRHLNETDWGSLESGARHKCEKCNHEWVIKND